MPITSIVQIDVNLQDSVHEYCEDCYVNTPPSFGQEHVEAIALISTVAWFDGNLSLNEFIEFFSAAQGGTVDAFGVTKSIDDTVRLSHEQSLAMQTIPVFSGFHSESLIEELYTFIKTRLLEGEKADQDLLAKVVMFNPDQHKILSCLIENAQAEKDYDSSWFLNLFSQAKCLPLTKDEEQQGFSRDDFMDFFRDDEKIATLTADDRVELFSHALIGDSDFTAELLNEVLADYDVAHRLQVIAI